MNVLALQYLLVFSDNALLGCVILPMIILLIIIIAPIWIGIQRANDEKKKLELQKEQKAKYQEAYKKEIEKQKQLLAQSQKDYFDSLEKLKSDSTNADLKQNTLQLGRKYSEVTRGFEGDGKITIYDEMALMNDINAACASSNSMNSQTVEERLSKLSELKDKNLISEIEYETKRQKVLDEI